MKLNPKGGKMTPRHIIVKLLKTSNKGENVKAPRKDRNRHVCAAEKGQDDSHFLSGKRQSRRQWSDMFKALKQKLSTSNFICSTMW